MSFRMFLLILVGLFFFLVILGLSLSPLPLD
jgi:hypothetical protein